jgi:hypothetical protein
MSQFTAPDTAEPEFLHLRRSGWMNGDLAVPL